MGTSAEINIDGEYFCIDMDGGDFEYLEDIIKEAIDIVSSWGVEERYIRTATLTKLTSDSAEQYMDGFMFGAYPGTADHKYEGHISENGILYFRRIKKS